MFDQELLQNKPGTRRQIIEAIVHLVTDMSKKSTQARRDSMRFLGAENEDQRLNAAKLLENMVININEDVPEPLQTLFEFE